MKNLYLSKGLAIRTRPALQELTANRVPDILPVLQNVFLKAPQRSRDAPEVLGQFVAARQLSVNPIVVHHWNKGTWAVDTVRREVDSREFPAAFSAANIQNQNQNHLVS